MTRTRSHQQFLLHPGKPDAMKIVIPDDYQDMVHLLASYALICHHDVVRYRAPARDLDQLVERLADADVAVRSEEHTSELQSLAYLVCRLRLEKKKTNIGYFTPFSKQQKQALLK